MSSVLSKFHVLYFPENPENIHFFCSNKFQLVYIFQNIIKRRDISLMSVLLSKFPDISFTYNVLQNIMRREFQIISSISSKLQVLLFVFPECNTRSCISLMSAVLSSPVLLKLEGKVTKFSSLQILQSGCNPRHLNSRAFLDCSGLHLDYMDYMVIKWIAEQGNPMQSKGNLCNPSAIHCNLGLQFCFAIQINLCNLTAIQEDYSLIAEIAV